MRRILLILLMFVLPLQWSWAAAASICEHEKEVKSAHMGHHEHEHHGQGGQPQAEQPDDKASADHPDCGVCHGIGTSLTSAEQTLTFAWDGRSSFAPYEAVIPDRSPDTLLRPPLDLVS